MNTNEQTPKQRKIAQLNNDLWVTTHTLKKQQKHLVSIQKNIMVCENNISWLQQRLAELEASPDE